MWTKILLKLLLLKWLFRDLFTIIFKLHFFSICISKPLIFRAQILKLFKMSFKIFLNGMILKLGQLILEGNISPFLKMYNIHKILVSLLMRKLFGIHLNCYMQVHQWKSNYSFYHLDLNPIIHVGCFFYDLSITWLLANYGKL